MNEPRLRSRRHLGKSLGPPRPLPKTRIFVACLKPWLFFLLRLGRQPPSPHPPDPDS